MKKTLWFIVFMGLFFVFSCGKDDNLQDNKNKASNPNYPQGENSSNFTDGNSKPGFASGQNGTTNFSSGGSHPNFGGNNNSGNETDETCILGGWITNKDNPTACPTYNFHLKLQFNANHSGEAWHLDEFLCTFNYHKYFNWSYANGNLTVTWDDSQLSSTYGFNCSSNSLKVDWLTVGNKKVLHRE
jgi:hypothetical protein